MHPAIRYTLLRLGLFVVVAAALFLFGFRSYAMVLLALLISMPLSYVLLSKPREAFARRVESRVSRRRASKQELRAALRGDDDRT